MLGRTHATSASAIAHAGLAYLLVRQIKVSSGEIEPTKWIGSENSIVLFDNTLIEPMNIASYFGIILGTTLFLMWLLRVGKPIVRWGSLGAIPAVYLYIWFVADNTYPIMILTLFLLFIFGSLLPDIDSEKSTLGRYVKFISEVIPHRTITHTLWIVLILGGLVYFTKSLYLLALTLGYVFHIVQDSFSRQGICWLYPISRYDTYGSGAVVKRRWKGRKPLLAYRTGGTFEWAIFILSIFLHLAAFGYLLAA